MGTEIRLLKNVTRKLNSDQQEECEEWALAQCKSDISVRHVEKWNVVSPGTVIFFHKMLQ